MANIIFLDIDGVLNSCRSAIAYCLTNPSGYRLSSAKGTDPEFDPMAVNMLRVLVQQTNAKIVISSTWRTHNDKNDFFEIFDWYDWDTRDVVIGETPKIHNVPRGAEIKKWIDDFESSPESDQHRYLILDDSRDMLAQQYPYFVFVDNTVGFGFGDYNKSCRILGCGEPKIQV